jgi:hypothetical protein
MPATSSIADCQRFAGLIRQAGGRVPDVLGHILAGADLMARHSASSDPARAIVDAAVAGELDEKRLTGLIEKAAHAQMVADYTGDARQRIEPLMVAAFHIALKNSACNEILDSLRPSWDHHAEAIAAARAVLNPESTPEHILASGEPAVITAWQGLNSHLKVIGAIAGIASQFGCRTAIFPQITEYPLGDGFRLDDRAVMCCDGPSLAADSAPFGRPDNGHRTSPWFRVALKLHTVDSARARYNDWASAEWERQHSGPRESIQGADGQFYERPKPPNPYKATELAT